MFILCNFIAALSIDPWIICSTIQVETVIFVKTNARDGKGRRDENTNKREALHEEKSVGNSLGGVHGGGDAPRDDFRCRGGAVYGGIRQGRNPADGRTAAGRHRAAGAYAGGRRNIVVAVPDRELPRLELFRDGGCRQGDGKHLFPPDRKYLHERETRRLE